MAPIDKKSKKTYFLAPKTLILISFLFFCGSFANAQITIDNPSSYGTLEEFLDAVNNYLFYIAVILVPLLFVLSGFYFVTAAGDPKRVEKAKKILFYTAIGLIVVFAARGLVSLVNSILAP